MTAYVVQDAWRHSNGVNLLVRVAPTFPSDESFIALLPNDFLDLASRIKKGVIVLVSKLLGLNLPAVVEVVGEPPAAEQPPTPSVMPIQPSLPFEDIEAPHPDDLPTIKRFIEMLEVQRAQITGMLALLR